MKLGNFHIPAAVAAVAILALFFHMGMLFWPYLNGTMRISNDYLGIPGETKIDSTYVSNPEYVLSRLAQENPVGGSDRSSEIAATSLSGEGEFGPLRLKFLEFQEFIKKNRLELEYQTQCGWIMHHHNTMLAPINEYMLGRAVTDINHQYGWLNTLLMGHLMKRTGGISFQNYLRVLYAFYPIYYALFLGTVFLLTRSPIFVLLTALVSFALLHMLNPIHILLAPGFNPLRQIFYLPVTLFLFFYFRRGNLLCLILAGLFSLVAVLSNREFGVFVLAAFVACLAVRMFHQKEKAGWREAAVIATTAGLALALLFFAKMGNNPMGHYYLRGISGPPMDKAIMAAALVLLSAGYAFLLKALNFRDPLKYVVLYLFIYSQGVFLYYVWNSAPNHFFSIASPMVFTAILFLKLGLEANGPRPYARPALAILAVLVFLGVYLPSGAAYYREKEKYEKIFEDRRVFEWNLSTAKFKTTMDPHPVYEAAERIQRYSPEAKAIFIISKYDNLLPFIAARYSAMPFSEVATSLLTRREVRLCIEAIISGNPEFIFVDTELVENPSGPGINSLHPMYLLASQHFDLDPKLKMLQELTRVYLGVIHRYEVWEKGPLLSVCRRKQG